MRKLVFVLSLAVLALGAQVVPVPVLSLAPGPAMSAPGQIEMEDPPSEVTGSLLVTTVAVSQVSLAAAVGAWLDPHRGVVLRPALIPPGVDPDEFIEFQRRLFEESGTVAVAVGLRRAGVSVAVEGAGARVVDLVEGSPAQNRLREGDVITAVDGRPVRVAADLVAATSRAQPGDELTLTVERGDDTLELEVPVAPISPEGRPALGVLVQTVGLSLQLPFDVAVRATDVGGPSAGLMLALAVYDLASAEDLTRERVIAGTGTLDLAGRVGPVGGVRQKVATARRAGATVFVVGSDEADEAREAAGEALTVIGVETIDDAIEALGR